MCIRDRNGASELITWAGYEASKFGISCIPSPSFVDYERSLNCWNSNFIHYELPKNWNDIFPQSFPLHPKGDGDVIWITNPHNPTGQYIVWIDPMKLTNYFF